MSEREKVRERVGEGGREWESQIVRVRKPLRTAKEPTLVLNNFIVRNNLGTSSCANICILYCFKYFESILKTETMSHHINQTFDLFAICAFSRNKVGLIWH